MSKRPVNEGREIAAEQGGPCEAERDQQPRARFSLYLAGSCASPEDSWAGPFFSFIVTGLVCPSVQMRAASSQCWRWLKQRANPSRKATPVAQQKTRVGNCEDCLILLSGPVHVRRYPIVLCSPLLDTQPVVRLVK